MKKSVSLIVALFCAIGLYAGDMHEGKVVEVVNGGGYTYLQIEDAQKKYWIAVTGLTIEKGVEVRFMEEMRTKNFESKSLNRKFDELMFASNLQHRSGVPEKGNLDLVSEHVEKSPYQQAGMMSIKEAFEKREALNGKSITVRAKVVKASPNIMARNWIHLQDGTGEGSSVGRIVFTSKDLPKVGDIVTATGVVAFDKDFGSGYFYTIIVENTTFVQ